MTPRITTPKIIDGEKVPAAEEFARLHESSLYSSQAQFEQMKIWRNVNYFLGVPAAILAAISGGKGFATPTQMHLPAVLALISAGFATSLAILNPSRKMMQAQAMANSYLEIQTASRQYMTIGIQTDTIEGVISKLNEITKARNELNKLAEPPMAIAYRRAKRQIALGGQNYEVDEKSQ